MRTDSFYSVLSRGEVTTPQLHFCVNFLNTHREMFDMDQMSSEQVVQSLLSHYHNTLYKGFQQLNGTAETIEISNVDCWNSVILDCANGVGSLAVNEFLKVYNSHTHTVNMEIDCRNNARDGPVNELCGAELVQKNQVKPHIKGLDYHGETAASVFLNKLFCSFDGDADRIIFHGFCNGYSINVIPFTLNRGCIF